MSRRPASFSANDVTRALKATVAAGESIDRVVLQTDGTIVVYTKAKGTEANSAPSLYEDWKANRNARSS